MEIAILGPGGVGGLLAALLSHEGASVTCIASESSVEQIRDHGLSLASEHFGDFDVSVGAESVLSQPTDVLVVTVKETDLTAALARVPSGLINDAIVVPFLNGIDHMQTLRSHFIRSRIVAGTIRVESLRTKVGEIRHLSPFAVVEIAPSEPIPPALAEFCGLLDRAGVDVEVRADESAILWGKLSVLAPLALLTTVHSASAGVIRTTHRGELIKVVGEVASVAERDGVRIDKGAVIAFLDSVPETMQSSMQRDLAAGRPIEIEAIGGAVVRHAQAHALDVPEIDRIVAELRVRSALE